MTPTLLAGLTGVVQGAQHALEPDHVTAVATVMVEAPSPLRGMFYAACWGLGHSAMLVFVAGPLVLLRIELPELVTTVLEVGVGLMLVYLGIRAFRGRGKGAALIPSEGPLHVRGRRPFAIGVVHGLAGSGALAALVAIGAPTAAAGLAALSLYALGTIVGMVALAALASPLLARAGRLPKLAASLMRATGVVSIAIGVIWIARNIAGV